jgi:hypothetical protein
MARGPGEHLALERHRAQDAVEGAEPVGGDQHATAIRQVVILPHLAAIMAGQAGDLGMRQHVLRVGSKCGRVQHRAASSTAKPPA